MNNLLLIRNEIDLGMIELWTYYKGSKYLWAVVHEDFLEGSDLEVGHGGLKCEVKEWRADVDNEK